MTRFNPVISTQADVPANVFRMELEAVLLGINDANSHIAGAVFADVFGVLVAEGKLSMANGMTIAHIAHLAAETKGCVSVDIADLARRAGV